MFKEYLSYRWKISVSHLFQIIIPIELTSDFFRKKLPLKPYRLYRRIIVLVKHRQRITTRLQRVYVRSVTTMVTRMDYTDRRRIRAILVDVNQSHRRCFDVKLR